MKISGFELMPYEIHVDNNNHTVSKPTGNTNKEDNPTYTNHGYYSGPIGALNKIAKLKTGERLEDESVVDIYNYIETLKEISKIIQLTNI